MKKYVISILIIIITLLTITLVIYKPSPDEQNSKTIYNRETRNYLNNNYYSSIIEKYEISNNEYKYTREIIYSIGDKQINTIEGYYIKEDNKLILDNKQTLYLIDNKLCLDSTCNISYTTNSTIIDHKISNFNAENHLIHLNDISFLKDDNSFKYIVIIKNNCSECDNYLNELTEVVKNYNLDIYFINTSNLQRKDYTSLLEDYHITNYPTTLIYINNIEKERLTNSLNKSSILDKLFKYNINLR